MWDFLREPLTWAVGVYSFGLLGVWLYFFPAAPRSDGKVPTWAVLLLFGFGSAGLIAIGALFPR
jgi:hypothetical protein